MNRTEQRELQLPGKRREGYAQLFTDATNAYPQTTLLLRKRKGLYALEDEAKTSYAAALLEHNGNVSAVTQRIGSGDVTGCNECEYHALLLGLQLARELHVQCLQAYTDSKLVRNQLNGFWNVYADNIIPLYLRARKELKQFKHYQLFWIPRQLNEEAHQLSQLQYETHYCIEPPPQERTPYTVRGRDPFPK